MNDRLFIFDTTLRDGEQALQQSLTAKQKLQIALCLEQLGVDVIEAGFPISSPGDLQSVREIGRTIKNSTICGLSRALDKDIDACRDALHETDHYRIHTFIATSPVHMEYKLKMSPEQVIERTAAMVAASSSGWWA